MKNEEFEQDVEFLRSCQKRLERLIAAMEGVPTLLVREEVIELPEGIQSLAQVEKATILKTLQAFNGDRLQAAKALGIGKTTLYRRLQEYR